MKVALVHDHLAQDGGAEKVLRYLAEIFPDSPIFVLVYDREVANPFFATRDIRPSFLQRLPGGVRRYKSYLPLMPTAIEKYDLKDFDVVLSSSSSLAKGVITDPRTLHICYCHTPTRYLWTDKDSYVAELPYNRFVKRLLPFYLNYLRLWDRLAADRVDFFVANSHEVARRIKKFYHHDSRIIYPPVEVGSYQPSSHVGNYFLAGGRLVPYKRFDLIVTAFNRLGLPLKIFGDGPELPALRREAHDNIEFVGRVSDQDQKKFYRQALAFIHPQTEDFGITMVESMASGRPVIAYKQGGALEIVREKVSGVFFSDQTWEALAETVIRFKPEEFSSSTIRQEAERFSVTKFKQEIKDFVDTAWQERILAFR